TRCTRSCSAGSPARSSRTETSVVLSRRRFGFVARRVAAPAAHDGADHRDDDEQCERDPCGLAEGVRDRAVLHPPGQQEPATGHQENAQKPGGPPPAAALRRHAALPLRYTRKGRTVAIAWTTPGAPRSPPSPRLGALATPTCRGPNACRPGRGPDRTAT